MKEKRVTKKAIFASLLSVAVCTSMLIGTSYAWFTDSVVSSGNVIKSGTLDIELSYMDGTKEETDEDTEEVTKVAVDPNADDAEWTDASNVAIFDYDLWEPGYVDVKHIKIANVGSLSLKYQFAIQANGELEKNDYGHTLADAIDVYYADPAVKVTGRTDDFFKEENRIGSLTEVLGGLGASGSGVLYAEDNKPAQDSLSKDVVTIALKMREDAGNEYQGMELGTTFSVQVLATQFTYEEDTFDDQYDANANGEPDNAVFPVTAVSNRKEFMDALDSVEDGGVVDLGGKNAIQLFRETVDKEVTIQNAKFVVGDSGANVNMYDTDFKKPVTFKGCDFDTGEDGLGIYHNKFEGGVVFEDCTFTGENNIAFYDNYVYGDVTFRNCKIAAKWCYAININGGSAGHTLTIDNCDIAGWVSFSSTSISKVIMKDSTFTGEDCEYKTARLYQNAEITNCTFDDSYDAIDACADNINIEFTNCTGIKGKFEYYGERSGVTWTVDGANVTDDTSYFVATP